jgi:hypothetical protein
LEVAAILSTAPCVAIPAQHSILMLAQPDSDIPDEVEHSYNIECLRLLQNKAPSLTFWLNWDIESLSHCGLYVLKKLGLCKFRQFAGFM